MHGTAAITTFPLMASVWKHPQSPFWTACYTGGDGRQRKKSTKILATEKNRRKAQRIADEMERAHRMRATRTQIFKMCCDLVRETTDEEMEPATVRGFLDGYLRRRAKEVSASTLAAYTGTVELFKSWLGERADMELFRVEARHVREFRDHLAENRHPTTANNRLKCLRIFFREAKRERLIFDNPCEDVSILAKPLAEQGRRAFTLDELRRVMREVQGTEWESLVRFGLYTGQRLGDISRLRWSQIDLEANEISIATSKSGGRKRVLIPICKPLLDHILTLEAGDEPGAFVHPRAAERGVAHLSREFGELLGRCGMRLAPQGHARKEGRTGERRELNPLSFHSLRHTAVSMMKNAGISPAVVQDLVGHDSAEMSAHYTHIETAAKRKALKSLPAI